MFTISQLGKNFSLSRSTLLYYESIKLLVCSQRNESNYRVYSDDDCKKLEQICALRNVGIPLLEIKKILYKSNSPLNETLHNRLDQLNLEIQKLRKQQQLIIKLLESKKLEKSLRILSKEKWISILKSIGMSDNEMSLWHKEFEKQAPEAHQDFLESLGITQTDIFKIRKWSRGNDSG